MGLEVDVRTAINTLVKKALPIVSEPCAVIAIDEQNGKCDVQPLNGTAEVLDVLLNSEGDLNTSFTIIPKIDSVVYITYYDKNNAFISLVAEIEKVVINNSVVSLELSDKLYLNGDELGGLVKASELKTQIDKLSDAVDKILNAINNGVPVAGDGGTALQTSQKLIIAGAETADLSNIENENVVQG